MLKMVSYSHVLYNTRSFLRRIRKLGSAKEKADLMRGSVAENVR